MDTNRNNQQEQNDQGGTGRTANNGKNTGSQQNQPAGQQRDISDVDQQEGDMNNGELGGNLGSDVKTSGSSNPNEA